MNIDHVFGHTTVWQMRPSKPVTLQQGGTVEDAIRVMSKHRVGCLNIVSGDKLVGVFTERDLCKKVVGVLQDYRLPLDSFMTANPEVVHRDDPVGKAIRMMNANPYRHLPVVDDDHRLLGLFSVRSLLNFLAEVFHTEVLNLPPSPNQISLTREGG